MNFAMRTFVGILAVSLLAPSVFANNNNVSVTSSTSVQQPKKEGRIWSGFFNMSRATSLVDYQDGTRQDSADYSGRINFKVNEAYSVRLQGGYSQDLNYPENNDFSDMSLGLFRAPSKFGKYVLLGYRVSATAPTSKDSYKRQSLQTSLSTALNWAVNPSRLLPGYDVSGSISVARNIHQYETALDGRVNTQYSSGQMIALGYSFKSGISLSAQAMHRNTWSYQNVMRDSFEFSQELGYQMNPMFSVALGHTNSGSSLRPNGYDSNVEVISEKTSIVYGSLTAVF